MTVVAAVLSRGIPVLVCDALLTTDGGARAGLVRKLVHLRRNLAIGWTGKLVEARALLDRVHRSLSQNPHLDEIAEHLTAHACDLGLRDLSLAGWLLRAGEPIAFLWSHERPRDLGLGKHVVIGSGADIFSFNSPRPFDVLDGNCRRAEWDILHVTGKLMESDLTDSINQRLCRFGFAYDVFIATGDSFRAVSPVVYSELVVELDEAHQVQAISQPRGILLHREYRGRTVVQHATDDGFDIHLIGPTIELESEPRKTRLENRFKRLGAPLPFKGANLVLFLQCFLPDGEHWPPVTLVMAKESDPWVDSTRKGFAIKTGVIQWLVDSISKDLRAKNAQQTDDVTRNAND